MATNLATFLHASKSEKLQKHSPSELTPTDQITAPKVMFGTYQIDAEPLAFPWVNAKRDHQLSEVTRWNSTCGQRRRS